MYFSALATGRVTVKHVKRKIELLSSKRWSACWPVNLLVRPALMTSLSVHTASSLTPRAVCVTKVRDEKEVSLEEMRNERKPSVWIITGRNHSLSLQACWTPLIQGLFGGFHRCATHDPTINYILMASQEMDYWNDQLTFGVVSFRRLPSPPTEDSTMTE